MRTPMSQPTKTVPDSPTSSSPPEGSTSSISIPAHRALRRNWDFWFLRAFLIIGSSLLCFTLAPFGVHGMAAAGIGFFAAMVIILAEFRLRRADTHGLMGGAVGTIIGLLASLLFTLVISRTTVPETSKSFFEFTSLFAFGYLGLIAGSNKGIALQEFGLQSSAEIPSTTTAGMKLVDTSVLIDGRIADICETHFLDGTLGVPRFVLHELQMVADSSDLLKRQRGRRGLEVLHRMQKMPSLCVRVLDDEISGSLGVDQKLMELARRTNSKIVTNDFNLNRVARLQAISVLNVNELANAMKPAVLPGEPMRVLILKEGKEPAQGVAYLDDGTMVVVDGARRLINRNIDIVVTSVHQTPAGKMIFGKLEDRSESPLSRPSGGAEFASNPPANGASRTDAHGKLDTQPRSPFPDGSSR